MNKDVKQAILYLTALVDPKKRNLQMPGDPRYQPNELKPFLGYDQWAGWLIIVEWFWMKTLADLGVISERDAKLLTEERLFRILRMITTTKQDEMEANLKHDILALLALMDKYLPKGLRKWRHYCATSYDIIDTAYALQLLATYQFAVKPMLESVSQLWRQRIRENAFVLQAGRTHLQTALPVTVGLWLANLHNRFIRTGRRLNEAATGLEMKFSGATGTYASQAVLIGNRTAEEVLAKMLGLHKADISTQIVPPESKARFYTELVLLSGAMANLGDDVRILQSSQFGELLSAASSSSAMPHKKANPIAAENDAGMHISVIAEYQKVVLTLTSNLQRDLRWSNVLRSFSAVLVHTYQQLKTTERILKTLKVDEDCCRKNFDVAGKLVVAELLHLALQAEGYPGTHHLVNKKVVPAAAKSGYNLKQEADLYAMDDPEFKKVWDKISQNIKNLLKHPEQYIGFAVEIAELEAQRELHYNPEF